jgi:hypothetical protein
VFFSLPIISPVLFVLPITSGPSDSEFNSEVCEHVNSRSKLSKSAFDNSSVLLVHLTMWPRAILSRSEFIGCSVTRRALRRGFRLVRERHFIGFRVTSRLGTVVPGRYLRNAYINGRSSCSICCRSSSSTPDGSLGISATYGGSCISSCGGCHVSSYSGSRASGESGCIRGCTNIRLGKTVGKDCTISSSDNEPSGSTYVEDGRWIHQQRINQCCETDDGLNER